MTLTATTPMHDFNSEQEGVTDLLRESVEILESLPKFEYVVIGGWCPFLRNRTNVQHPGTLDVDLLFRHSSRPEALKDVFTAFLNRGFAISAKHRFQLMRMSTVRGQKVVFTIDILHPLMQQDIVNGRLFVDHLQLDVPIDPQARRLKTMVSVVLPNSDVLFSERLFSEWTMGEYAVPLMTFDGMLLTKMTSCQRQKRERDAFDIYLAFLNDGVDMARVRAIAKRNESVDTALAQFSQYLAEQSGDFDKNVAAFLAGPETPAAAYVLRRITGDSP